MSFYRTPAALLLTTLCLAPAVGQEHLPEPSLETNASLLFASTPQAALAGAGMVRVDDGRGTAYIVETSDNISGLDNPRQLTRPARVSYPVLLAATPEMKTLKKDRVNPNSPRGIQLRNGAAARVGKACEKARGLGKFCSVWKRITRRDKKNVPDITAVVKKQLQTP